MKNKNICANEQVASAIVRTLLTKNNFIIVGHISPDGDAVGSALALYNFLVEQGKKVKVGWGEKISLPSQYNFLPGQSALESIANGKDASCCEVENKDKFNLALAEVLLAVDVATEERLGSVKNILDKVDLVINLDHHPDNTCFGALNLVVPTASSTAEIVFSLLKETGLKISFNVATCLYVALATDTGQFQYANTTPAAFKMASELITLGVKPNTISQNLYETHSFAKIKLLGRALSKAVFNPQLKLIYTYIDKDDLKSTGATVGDTERLIDHLRAVEGVQVAMLIKALDKHMKVSLRAKDKFDVSALAHHFKGGGHKGAAGFIYKGTLEQLLAEVSKLLSTSDHE